MYNIMIVSFDKSYDIKNNIIYIFFINLIFCSVHKLNFSCINKSRRKPFIADTFEVLEIIFIRSLTIKLKE